MFRDSCLPDSLVTARRFGLAALPLAILCSSPGHAIEQSVPLPLATAPAGSTGRAVAVAGPSAYWVAGAIRNAAGATQATAWRIAIDPSDPSGNTVFAVPLPTPPGATSVATGIALRGGDPDRPVIVGQIPAADGTPRGVVWTREGATFEAIALESGTEPSSVAHAAGVTAIAGRCRQPDGLWRACVWRSQEGTFERTDLGSVDGAESTALDIAVDADGAGFLVAGGAQSAAGRWLAILVEVDRDAIRSQVLPTPSGASSLARSVEVVNGRILAAGEVSRGGRSRGVAWLEPAAGAGPVLQALPLPDGFDNSSLNGLLPSSPDGELLLAAGTAWNLPDATSAYGAILRAGREPYAFTMTQLRGRTETIDKDETITIHSNWTESGSGLAGDLLVAATGLVQAGLLLPYVVDGATIETPDAVSVPVGAVAGPEREARATRLWQADGESLRVAPRGTAPELRIVIEFTSAGLKSPRDSASGQATLRSRIEPQNARSPSTADVRLQLLEPASGSWVEVGRLAVGTEFADQTVVIDDPGRFVVPGGSSIRGRVVVLAGSDRLAYELDQLTIGRIALP